MCDLGNDSPEVLQAFVIALDDTRTGEKHGYGAVGERNVGEFARDALNEIGKPAVPHLAKVAVEGKTPRVRALALRALEWLKEDARIASDAITHALKNEDEWVRRNVVTSLKEYCSPTPDVIALLVRALDDEDDWNRELACQTLQEYGPAAAAALPKLREILASDENCSVRYDAESAIDAIEKKEKDERP